MNNLVQLRPLQEMDIVGAVRLFNDSCQNKEVVYSPISEELFKNDFLKPNMHVFVAVLRDKLIGFVHGVQQDIFLAHQTHENTPGFLTLVFVDKSHRRQGIGKNLVHMLEDAFRDARKKEIACSHENPLHLTWRIPGKQEHDHNKAPGVDVKCAGYPFLLKIGFETIHQDIAMYLDLKDYAWPENITMARERLAQEGIYTGRYDASLYYDYNGMCDRVESEYWRHVLKMETEAWQKGRPCEDPDLWADGIKPFSPRPILAATHDCHIVGFTGPVDKQKSGRGWFTGICVDPLYGRRSIGEVLFHLLMQEFVNEGATFSTLFTGLDNHAQTIYERAGFHVVCRFAAMAKQMQQV